MVKSKSTGGNGMEIKMTPLEERGLAIWGKTIISGSTPVPDSGLHITNSHMPSAGILTNILTKAKTPNVEILKTNTNNVKIIPTPDSSTITPIRTQKPAQTIENSTLSASESFLKLKQKKIQLEALKLKFEIDKYKFENPHFKFTYNLSDFL